MYKDCKFEELCLKGLKQKYGHITKGIKYRLNYELAVVRRAGAIDYLLFLEDIIEFTKQNSILTSPGRGTAPGSLVCFSLGITKVDPIRYGLFFESFINPELLKYPAICFDVDREKKDKVIAYIENRYGKKEEAGRAGDLNNEVTIIGSNILAVISDTLKTIEQLKGKIINIDAIPLDDKKVYQLISNTDTDDVFQLADHRMRKVLGKTKPQNIKELAILISLCNPQWSNKTDIFVKRKTVKYLYPKLEPILKETSGVIIFQEQVLQIVISLAGFSLSQADKFRIVLNRKNPKQVRKQKDLFLYGAEKRGIAQVTAVKIFDELVLSSPCAIKAHNYSYAVLTYQSAYLKTYYPNEYILRNPGG